MVQSRSSPLCAVGGLVSSVRKQFLLGGSAHIDLVNRKQPSSILTVSFPGRTVAEAWRFTMIIKVLEVVKEGLQTGRMITKRDIYYQHVNLFRSQNTVDRIVDDLAATLQAQRSTLNVIAAPKGLVAGNIKIHLSNGAVVDCLQVRGGTLIPRATDIAWIEKGGVKWILIVEKEAVFSSLVQSRDNLLTEGVIITGKGYPDLATREFLRFLTQIIHARVFALVDYDPYGIDIIGNYKFGSTAMTHESVNLNSKSVEWMGLQSYHIQSSIVNKTRGYRSFYNGDCTLLTLSWRDRKKSIVLLQKSYIVSQPIWTVELQRMMFYGIKAELEVVDSQNGDLEEYVRQLLLMSHT